MQRLREAARDIQWEMPLAAERESRAADLIESQQAEIERLRRTVQDRDEWNEHLASRESSLLLAVPRPFRTWVDRRARKEARRG